MWRDLGPWRPVSRLGFAGVTGALALLVSLLLTSPEGYIRVLDDANLVFHETGHPVFAVFGRTLGLLGGTLGQLAVPFVAAIAFWRRREPVSVAIALFWFFENFFSIGRYMADARALVLPLVGGDIHDWNALFAQWGVLRQNLQIAAVVRTLGGCGLAATWGWVAWRWWMDRATVAPHGEELPPQFAALLRAATEAQRSAGTSRAVSSVTRPRTPPAPAATSSGRRDARSPREAAG